MCAWHVRDTSGNHRVQIHIGEEGCEDCGAIDENLTATVKVHAYNVYRHISRARAYPVGRDGSDSRISCSKGRAGDSGTRRKERAAASRCCRVLDKGSCYVRASSYRLIG